MVAAGMALPQTAVGAAASSKPPAPGVLSPVVTHYRTAEVNGVKLFYREAGQKGAPVVLLLHGFPTSSHMFRNLIPALADRYHVIAPDYPGYGQSDAPDHTKFAYTFDHLATEHLAPFALRTLLLRRRAIRYFHMFALARRPDKDKAG